MRSLQLQVSNHILKVKQCGVRSLHNVSRLRLRILRLEKGTCHVWYHCLANS